MDIGCGLGIDLIFVANELLKHNRKGRIFGVDFNS